MRAVDTDRHRLLFASVGTGPEGRRSPAVSKPAIPDQLIATADFLNLMDLADFEVISGEQRNCSPAACSDLDRSSTGTSRRYRPSGNCAAHWSARPVRQFPDRKLSASILIPFATSAAISKTPSCGCRDLVRRRRSFRRRQFQRRHIRGMRAGSRAYRESWDIKVLKQDGKGKGDAVRKGFAAASKDVLMILDADLTMPPEALPKYHAVIESGKAKFVNGTRLVYPMENEAMRPLNFIANRCSPICSATW